MNSESVKPLLSAEDNKWKFGPSDREVAEWFSGNIDSECSASSAIFKFRLWLEEYASQLQPSSPQLEQEWRERFDNALAANMDTEDEYEKGWRGGAFWAANWFEENVIATQSQEVKRLQEENERLQARIAELERQLSWADEVNTVGLKMMSTLSKFFHPEYTSMVSVKNTALYNEIVNVMQEAMQAPFRIAFRPDSEK